MEHDREGQVGARSGSGDTSGAGGTDERLDSGLGRDDTTGDLGHAGDLGPRSTFAENAQAASTTGFGATADDAGTRAGSYDRKFTDELSGDTAGSRMPNEGGVRTAVSSGKNRIAEQLQRAGERIEERARELEGSGGMQRRAGQLAHRASDAIDSGAHYLRDHEIDEMRDDLEQAIRARPLLSVGIAAGAGFLLARILRD